MKKYYAVTLLGLVLALSGCQRKVEEFPAESKTVVVDENMVIRLVCIEGMEYWYGRDSVRGGAVLSPRLNSGNASRREGYRCTNKKDRE